MHGCRKISVRPQVFDGIHILELYKLMQFIACVYSIEFSCIHSVFNITSYTHIRTVGMATYRILLRYAARIIIGSGLLNGFTTR